VSNISLGELGVRWFEDAIQLVTNWFQSGLREGYQTLTPLLFGTPTPTTKGALVFGEPTNAPWPMLHDSLVGGEVTLLALLTLVVSVQGRHAIRVFNIGSAYEDRRTKRTAWTGAFLIVIWYWLAAVTLMLVEGFTLALLPDIETLFGVLMQFLTVALTNPALAFLMASLGAIAMWVLQALFFIRGILLLVYVYAMPFGIAFAFANLPVISQIARALCLRFIPLAILPLPVALLFAGYGFLFNDGSLVFDSVSGAFFQLLVATSLPILAVWVAWKTFGYATPAVAHVTGTIGRTALTAGAIAGVSTVGTPAIAAAASQEGPRRALQTAAAKQLATRTSNGTERDGEGRVSAHQRPDDDPRNY
jgi:hypothetical protein